MAIPVAAPPPIPMTTQGQAFDGAGSPLPLGTPIRTFVDGVNYSDDARVRTAGGTYTVVTVGNSKTNANVSDTPTIQEGANLGDVVIFATGDFTTGTGTRIFRETVPWFPAANVTLNLNAGSAATTPQPVKIQGIVTLPAKGGNQSVYVCNPSPVSVSLADYYFEVDALGTYHGGSLSLSGVVPPLAIVRENLSSPTWLTPTGDALKLVYRNPGGVAASAGGRDIAVDRVEFNATSGGTLYWEPGNTIMGDAPAPGPGQILERDPSCTDTNRPSDFSLGIEPGVNPNSSVMVAITAPTSGQSIPTGGPAALAWTLSDTVFLSGYVRVWANVTIGSRVIPVLVNQPGRTSVSWTPPDLAGDAALKVDAVDPFGAHASATTTFTLTRQSPLALFVAVLIVVVIAGLLIISFLRRRKERRSPPTPTPEGPPTRPETPPVASPTVAGAEALARKKICPRCHTAVNAIDPSCFFCGYSFPEEKPPP